MATVASSLAVTNLRRETACARILCHQDTELCRVRFQAEKETTWFTETVISERFIMPPSPPRHPPLYYSSLQSRCSATALCLPSLSAACLH